MTTQPRFIIGLDSTTFGRGVRLILGLLILLMVVEVMIDAEIDVLLVLVNLLIILAVYSIAYLALEKPLLSRMNAWLNALIFVVSVLVAAFVPVFPAGLRLGMLVYLGFSLVVNALIRYGGCEVLAVPTFVFRRRYSVYCPTNMIEIAEQMVARSRGKALHATQQDE